MATPTRFAAKLGRQVSRVAFGAARLGERRVVSAGVSTTEDVPSVPALLHAITSGINVIDTSTMYGQDGASETEIGRAIQHLDRQDVVLISKCGYKFHREQNGDGDSNNSNNSNNSNTLAPSSDDHNEVPVGDNVSSYFHPTFIQDELTCSLKRMQVKSLDAYLLHNPEHYLEHHLPLNSTLDMTSIADQRVTFMEDVVLPAFVALEEEVQKGRICSYGVSSKCFNHGTTHPHWFDPQSFLQVAEKAALQVHGRTAKQQHSFDVIQMPMNPFEASGIDVVRDLATKHGIHVMLNRPLSPVDRQGVWRLVDGIGRSTKGAQDVQVEAEVKLVEEKKGEKRVEQEQAGGPFKARSFEHLLAGWERIPSVVSMREAREAAFSHFTPPAPKNSEMPTSDELEIIEACIFLCSLIRDMDREMDQFTSFQHYEQNIMNGIVPVIHEKIEGMDEDSTSVLMKFFEAYGKAVREVIPFVTREKMKSILNPLGGTTKMNSEAGVGGDESGDEKKGEKKESISGMGLHMSERPHEIDDEMSLEEYSLRWINQVECGNIVVGMTAEEHVDFALKYVSSSR